VGTVPGISGNCVQLKKKSVHVRRSVFAVVLGCRQSSVMGSEMDRKLHWVLELGPSERTFAMNSPS
jgi:hypothetical protein